MMSTEVVSESPAAIRLIAQVGDTEWDDFVSAQPTASAYHYSGWARLIGRTFGHDVRMLETDSERSKETAKNARNLAWGAATTGVGALVLWVIDRVKNGHPH